MTNKGLHSEWDYKDSNYYRKLRCMTIPGVKGTQWSVTDLITKRQFGNSFKDKPFSAYNTCQLHNAFIPNKRRSLVEVEKENDYGFIVSLSSNGQYLATSRSNQPIRLYDATTSHYKFISKISSMNECMLNIGFSPNNEYVAYTTCSEYIFLEPTDVKKENVDCRLKLDPSDVNLLLTSFVFTDCGRSILVGAQNSVFDYDLVSESIISKTLITYRSSDIHITALEFVSRDLNIYYAGENRGSIYIMDRRCNERVGVFNGHRDCITCIDSDETYLISNSLDHSIILWDLRQFSKASRLQDLGFMHSYNAKWNNSIRTYTGHLVSCVTAEAKFSPMISGQKYIYTGCKRGTLILYDVLTGSIMQKIEGQGQRVNCVAWHSKRPEIITSSNEGVNLNVYIED